jgi:hypothetical protein
MDINYKNGTFLNIVVSELTHYSSLPFLVLLEIETKPRLKNNFNNLSLQNIYCVNTLLVSY